MSPSKLLARWSVCAGLCAALLACPKPPPVEDGGTTVGDAGGGDGGGDIDAGPEDAGFKCRIDDDCAVLQQGLRCEERTGECIPAKPCNDDTHCDSLDENDYCYHYGIQCRCVQEANDGGGTGVCRRRREVCQECTEDSQCGQGGTFDPPGACRALEGDTSGKKYCFRAVQGPSCPCGMVNDGQGYCRPQSNDCSAVGCGKDSDCPSGSVCNTAQCLCEPRCRWDFAEQREALPGCPPGKVCWVDQANLDPNSIYYGAGRCRPPCTSDQECTDTTSNPFGGSKLKCAAEELKGGGESPKRCRANGECMDDLECPELPESSLSIGYCDRAMFQCKTDCRTGVDPVTGEAYQDCRPGYGCEPSTGGNVCVLKTCAELGGARIACRRGQYCCGEDKNGDGVADPCPPAAQLEPNKCYDAPKPPFCTPCEKHEDCTNYTPPAYLTGAGACANGSKSPSCSPLPNLCVYAGDRGMGVEGIFVCAPSTFNDTTKDSFHVGKDFKGCPPGYSPVGIKPKLVEGDNYCETNADCSIGHDAGICAPDPNTTLEDGGHPKVCMCTQPGQPAECPNTTDGGITSVCKYGIVSPTVCLQSVVCMPSPGLVYKDAGAPDFGCGL